MEEIGLSYIPYNFYDSNEDQKENNEEEKEQKEAQEQKDLIIQNVSNVINKITSLASNEEEQEIDEEKEPEFVPGIIRDQTKLFNEYRTNFQNRFFHNLEKDIFDDTKKLLSSSFLFIEKADNKNTKLLNYDQIELQDISYNLDNSNYVESYKKVNNILDELLTNFASLKSFQQERIKPKFVDEDIQNKKIDGEIDKLIIKMMKKIKFCEALTKMIKEKKSEVNTSLEKVKNNIKIFLTTKIQNFSNEFRQNQQQYLKYLKDMGIIIYSNEDKNNKSESLLNDNDDEKKNFLYTKDDDVNIQIKKRDEDIDILVKSINELSGIFKDLQNIVQEQGTILDRIDYNINISYENSQEGLKNLKKAEQHNNESCFRNAILLLFFIIFVETILIICKLL
jgi:syntaxin 16